MADPGISNPHGAGRHAPRRGPAVSRLAFGGAPIGNLYAGVDETIARLAVERAWQHGIRHFDTAPYYGYGLAEQRLGAALAGVPRASYTLSTKVGRLIEDAPGRDALADGFDVAGKRAVFDYSRDGVRRAVDASLRRLGVEHVDVLLLHDIGALTHGAGHPRILRQALDEALPALAELRAQGVCGAIGLGVNEEAVCLEVMPRFELDVIMLAGRYTLFEQEHGAQVMAEALQRGVSIFAAAPYNSGLLGATSPATPTTTRPPMPRCARGRSASTTSAPRPAPASVPPRCSSRCSIRPSPPWCAACARRPRLTPPPRGAIRRCPNSCGRGCAPPACWASMR